MLEENEVAVDRVAVFEFSTIGLKRDVDKSTLGCSLAGGGISATDGDGQASELKRDGAGKVGSNSMPRCNVCGTDEKLSLWEIGCSGGTVDG